MSPSLLSFVSLFNLLVSAVLCWFVVLRRVCMLNVHSSLPVCLPVFPLRGGFCCSLFYCIIKINILLRLSPRLHLSSQSLTERISQYEDSAEEGFGSSTTRHYLQPPIPMHPPVWGPELLPSAGQWCEEVCRGVQWCSREVRLQRSGPQGPLQQYP